MNRDDYRNENGLATWWRKDGLWHVARPIPDGHINPGNLRFTNEEFRTREEAVAALESADPTPWCHACGAKTQSACHCGPIASNE